MRENEQRQDVTAIVVTFHPGEQCATLLRSLSEQCGDVVVVDNGSTRGELELLREWCARTRCDLVEIGDNIGIAAAQNVGIRRARSRGASRILLSDDDSVPSSRMVARLASSLDRVNGPRKVAAIGPLVGETRPGGDQLVYRARKWGPRRATPEELACSYLPVAFLIASGSLIDLEALADIGPMNEQLFIDHVDLEWGLRATRAGYALLVDTAVPMGHSLGELTVQLKGRPQPIHVHAPVRNYYLTRNTVALIQSGLLPWRWDIGYALWLAKYAAFNILLVNERPRRLCMVARGIVDGVRGKGGRLKTRA